MARELSQQTEEAGDAISQAFQDLDADIQQRFYNLFPKNVKNTHEQDIRAAIARQPDQGKTEAIISEAIHGSCACAVYIKDGVVYAANTGDSRVVSKYLKSDASASAHYLNQLWVRMNKGIGRVDDWWKNNLLQVLNGVNTCYLNIQMTNQMSLSWESVSLA